MRYFCKHKHRRQAVRDHGGINGIDYLEVMDRDAELVGGPRQQTLLVYCVNTLSVPVSSENVLITGGVRITPVQVKWAAPATESAVLYGDNLISEEERDYFLGLEAPEHNIILVRTDSWGDYSTYRLQLITDHAPLIGFDPLLTTIDFSFKVECPSDFDCKPAEVCAPEQQQAPPIDYLAKDYASFRRVMLDRLSVIMPDWQDRLPADLGMALVELMAYSADHLSYYQDGVATEAYLGTARRRPSVRRHARLFNYAMHDGCNARAWVTVQVEAGVRNVVLKREYAAGKKTHLLSRIPSRGPIIAEDDFDIIVRERQPLVFELLHDLRLFHLHNRLRFYTWGDTECCLPRGATRATLLDDEVNRLLLVPGDVLIFEEVKGPLTGAPADADPLHRHAVRLLRVDPQAVVDEHGNRSSGPIRRDELYNQAVVEIEWMVADSLPFPLCLSAMIEENGEEVYHQDISIGHGNVVLADYGRTIENEVLPDPGRKTEYRPVFDKADITMREPFDETGWITLNPQGQPIMAAGDALMQDPRKALPAAELLGDDSEIWRPERDLLASDRFDPDFVVEMESDGRGTLRFGDNIYGKRPEAGVGLTATYRIGSGNVGNVGADAVYHITTASGIGIEAVRNPLPAVGGRAPEKMEEVRQYAPRAFRRQERAVTEEDYAMVAQRHPEVSRAVARRRWTGSWHTMFVTIDRLGGRPVDQDFEDELSAFLERYQLAGHDVEIEPPRFVPLDVALNVCVKQGYLRSDVQQALLEVFSSYALAGGGLGYFHPDNFTFGQPVYLSRLIARAMEIPGVRWIKVDRSGTRPGRFQRWGRRAHTEIEDGYIDISRFEIARLDNDANAPENGKLEFLMEGGL